MVDFNRIFELQQQAGRVAIATVVRVQGSTPRQIGARMVVLPDGSTEGTIGGGRLEQEAVADALALLDRSGTDERGGSHVRSGRSGGCAYKEYRLLPEEQEGIGSQCGGNVDLFIEIAGDPRPLLIIGGGHIGLALCRLALELDYQVTIVDDRAEFAAPERFPGAKTLQLSYADPALCELVTPETSVVLVTHGHRNDAQALKLLLAADTPATYIGMIGSKRKVITTREQLLAQGVDQARLDQVYTPVGLDLGAESPAEIALSILAEIVNVRRRGGPSEIGMGRR